LHGITKPTHLVVNHFHCGINPIAMRNVCGVDAATLIKRSEFDIDKDVLMISDEVRITIQVETPPN
jgi:polyisoprenoid-binding protein YceI